MSTICAHILKKIVGAIFLKGKTERKRGKSILPVEEFWSLSLQSGSLVGGANLNIKFKLPASFCFWGVTKTQTQKIFLNNQVFLGNLRLSECNTKSKKIINSKHGGWNT